MLRASADVLRADIDLSGHELAARDTSLFAGRTSDPYVIFKQEDAQVLSTRTEHSSGACASFRHKHSKRLSLPTCVCITSHIVHACCL